ncbi:ABC transporter permease [Streptomyces sp. NPDC047070]|uniref:ABC transporter permease n=1 Tax=Streptomyces sp. NPDC047070 TaxID=3154923 RepID=UPI0034536C8A
MTVLTAPDKRPEKTPAASGRRHRPRTVSPFVLNLAALALGIAVWAVATSAQLVDVPGPLSVGSRALDMAGDGTLGEDALASLRRVFLGFTLGTLLAVPVGFLMGWYPLARGLLEPYVQFFRTVPPLAIIPLAIVTMGIGETPKVFVIFLAAFLSSVVAAFQGVIGVDSTLVNAARVLGARDRVIFLKVVVPAATPFLLVGMRIGLGASWATVVAAELIAADKGLGYEMMHAQTYYDLPTIFVGLISIGVIGLVMDRLLLRAERHLTAWQERR